MIQIRASKNNCLVLSDRRQTLELRAAQISFNGTTIGEAGEYEKDGIEIVYATASALIVWERLQFVYVFDSKNPSEFEKTNFAPCNTLIFALNLSAMDKSTFNAWVEVFDPNIVAVTNRETLDEQLAKTVKLQPTNQLKVTIQTLPTEDRQFYLLSGADAVA